MKLALSKELYHVEDQYRFATGQFETGRLLENLH
jgi:hypothetical protein